MIDEWNPSGNAFAVWIEKRDLLSIVIEKGMIIQIYTTPTEFVCIIV